MKELSTQILIVGGGLGGVAAALSALKMGCKVILTEETDWLGGQMTAQAVPPDEHPWIESTGCTSSYRQLRDGVREFYRKYYPLKPEVASNSTFNPGEGDVSFLCHEPKVSLNVIQSMLLPFEANCKLQVLLNNRAIRASVDQDSIDSVTLQNTITGETTIIVSEFVIDATELGDLLPLANIEHIIGAESQKQTGEMHALVGDPDPMDQQSITACFIMDYIPDGNYIIEKPSEYEFWKTYKADFWPDLQLSWSYTEPIGLQSVTRQLFNGPSDQVAAEDMWHYRRNFYRGNYPVGRYESDSTIVNWPQNDYWLGPLVGVSPEESQNNAKRARQLSLSFLYWMQTEAPRPEGGYGFPGLRLRGDSVGNTPDGLAKSIYIRESRRIQAQFTVCEQHIGMEARGNLVGAEQFFDSVGIGTYRIDLHPSTSLRTYIDIPSWPFQIPLGSLIPVRVKNYLPACKNLGVTHITNGCYREHPTEWNIGESAGALAAFCLNLNKLPLQIWQDHKLLNEYQKVLSEKLGILLRWPEEIRITPRNKNNPLGF